jgi:16S rRNA (cytosine1402-N4)-methyltransferase
MDNVLSDNAEHIPVLANKLVEQIILPHDAVMVDATVGHGGHSFLFGQHFNKDGTVVAFDVDKGSLNKAKEELSILKCRVLFVNANFAEIQQKLFENGIKEVDFILADLGFCSAQLLDNEIGLSFQTDAPLDMRLDKRLKASAADLINTLSEEELANVIYNYGEDRASRRIARYIVENRPIYTTHQLASVVSRALGIKSKGRKQKIHPATKTFQALRIAVNDELNKLNELLETAPKCLKRDGKIAIISFHSLEDRIVKNNFKQLKADNIYKIITKKPITADSDEMSENPCSRSAKLRIAQKL